VNGYDKTTHGAFIDAWFTTAGLYMYDPINNVYLQNVTVEQFAKYFGFDHFNWQQTVTIPSTWAAKDDYSGKDLGRTFPDPQPHDVTLTGYLNNTNTIPTNGDKTGLYLPSSMWKQLYVNRLSLATNPTPGILGLPNSQYYFAFEDCPLLSSTMYGSTGMLQFTTTLVGVKYGGGTVSLASSSGTSFAWQSNTGTITRYSIDTGGVNFVGYLQTFDPPPDLILNSGGISNVQFVAGDSPAVTANPNNQAAGAGAGVSFAASAIGSPPPAVQWQVSTDGGNTFSNIAGATSTTLAFTAGAAQNGNEYRAVFTNSAGSAITTAATLTIATSPIVTTDPASQVASAWNPVTFVAEAAGTPAPTVQWQVSTDGGNTFSNIAGATSTTYTTTATTAQNGDEYRAVFTNSSGSARTAPATLTVNTTPSSLVIDAASGVFPQFNLNPPPNLGNDYFGSSVVQLTNGNVVVTAVGSESAANFYNGQTGVLISALTGLGSEGPTVTALPNGNFVVDSPDWANGVGAVTWVNGTTGLNGTPSAVNSLIGSTVFDHVGGLPGASGGVMALANSNYVVASPSWGSNGSTNGLGAVTWGNGETGISGVVSAANSLVGSTVGDNVGSGNANGVNGVTALTNGNYVVDSIYWGGSLGAVTWGNGTAGITGAVSAANSLVGSIAGGGGAGDNVGWGDYLGQDGVIVLTDGNYVVDSSRWNGQVGAVTWGNGMTGIKGAVSAANSLVGSNAIPTEPDMVGSGGVTALTNGNYVVDSPSWASDNSNELVGAVTWANGTTGISGTVSTSNSLVGENLGDQIGGIDTTIGISPGTGVTALANGNYVVNSPAWGTTLSIQAGAGAIPLGAVTWEDGTRPATGTVSASNSLVGYTPGDVLGNGGELGYGGVTALANGNYVVDSPNWGNSPTNLNGLGAVTWGNGMTGTKGMISSSNSLVGSFLGDQIGVGSGGGFGGIVALTNGNYVVDSPNWYAQSGAVTWGNGTKGTSGAVSAANSLVGDAPGDEVGGSVSSNSGSNGGGVTALTNGNYVVLTPNKGTATCNCLAGLFTICTLFRTILVAEKRLDFRRYRIHWSTGM
jgi:hypothetical protein